MELRHLRYFVAVATELHFGRAAGRVFVSQPALSQQILNLEAELGFSLFVRDRRRVELSPAGAALLPEALAILDRVEAATALVRSVGAGSRGRLRVAVTPSLPGGVVEATVEEFRHRYTDIDFELGSGTTSQNLSALRRGSMQLVVVHPPIPDIPDVTCVEISTEPIVVGLASDHPLTRHRRLRRDHLTGLPLIYFPRRTDPGLHDRILAEVYGPDHTPDIVRLEPSEDRRIVAVAEGTGVTLLLRSRATTLRTRGVVYRRFIAPEPRARVGLAYKTPPTPATQQFLALATEINQPDQAAAAGGD
ncbi:MAG TPA: LysR substrate-binding domain-containing protein [Actinophytocola sp.]|uniref:LysR family transcriptional regulator n=1 Tax=Actinophytocola sp. TaxID=1872138 RepID=UPI002DFE84F4|nr:LysR substrate-binding domain-containing protein [Actinophytocola sp.]